MKVPYLILFAAVLVCFGCSNTFLVTYEVSSKPTGAAIEVDGVPMGVTPTTIQLEVTKVRVDRTVNLDWYGHGGETYNVTAHPPSNADGNITTQTKKLTPALTNGVRNLFFDLTVKPILPQTPN